VKTTNVGIMDINVNISILEQGFEIPIIEQKTPNNRYEPKGVL
jgi:hypothetical protein